MYLAAMVDAFNILWLCWLLMFAVIELTALFLVKKSSIDPNQRYGGYTFSELIWRITRSNRLVFVLTSMLWVVLAIHFFYQ